MEPLSEHNPAEPHRSWRRRAVTFASFLLLLLGYAFYHEGARYTLNDLLLLPLVVRDSLPESFDAIIVHGGDIRFPHSERLDYAMALLKTYGAHPLVLSDDVPCSNLMRDYVLKRNVPDSALYVDDQSNSTFDNVMRSREICERHGWDTILVVTSPFHSRRSIGVWRKLAPKIVSYSAPSQRSMLTEVRGRMRWIGLKYLIREYIALADYWWRGRL